ncbi:MAG TPA: sulfotransferase [Rubrobacter sp.]
MAMYPDFIGIGAQKSGTTWLHRNLHAHPQLWLPRKEVHYFDKKINDNSNALSRLLGKGGEDARWRRQTWHWLKIHTLKRPSLRELRWIFKYYMRPYNDGWYGKIFEPKRGRIAGEITPAYSVLSEDRVAHVHELVPGAKLIFMMRNPIERAWSQAVMSFDKEAKGSAESASEEELLKRFGRNSSRLLTDYLRTLENWSAFYPEEQIFVGFLEDVSLFPGELLGRIYGFLGADTSFEPPSLNKKIHSRSSDTMPTSLAAYLAHEYREETERLASLFGGYASFWSYCARRLIEDPPEEERIPYPLWGSSLWEDWKDEIAADEEPVPHSGPLSSIQVAS